MKNTSEAGNTLVETKTVNGTKVAIEWVAGGKGVVECGVIVRPGTAGAYKGVVVSTALLRPSGPIQPEDGRMLSEIQFAQKDEEKSKEEDEDG